MSPMVTPCTLLHVACAIPSVPRDIITTILHVFPKAVLLVDEDGNLPIHAVCALVTTRPDLIQLLLNACPETSFKPSREEQELPFYLLINHYIQNVGLKAAFELISSLPPSLIYNDSISVLHQVCNDLLPEAICHKLIELYPDICKIHNNGNTLLHIMCSHRNSTASLIQRIINICPENCTIRDDHGNVPLHLVNSQQQSLEIIRMLMACYPHALLVQNSSAQIPLVSPLIRSSSRRVKEILRFCTSAENISVNTILQVRNRYGMLPLQDYFYDLQRQITCQVLKGIISTEDLSSCGRMQSYTKLFANNLESFFYLMRVAVYNDVDYALEAPHQASFWTTFPIFTKTLLRHSPELACHKDCHGDLPLHIIAKHEFQQLHSAQCSYCKTNISGPYLWFQQKTYSCRECSNLSYTNPQHLQSALIEYQGNELIKDVLAVNPSAANVKDSEGNLPLHLSLKSGKTWSTGINELVKAAPFAIGAMDEESSMFPFMLAAEGKNSDGTLDPGQKLSTIYELLRRGPSLIR
jgi:ankyrin repeat protein